MAFRVQPDYTTLCQAATRPWRGLKTFNTNHTQCVQEAGTFLLFHENTPEGSASLSREGARSLRSPELPGWLLLQRWHPASPGGDGHTMTGTPGPTHCAQLGAAPTPRGAGDTVTRSRPQGTAAGRTMGSGLRLCVQIPALPLLFIWHQSPAQCARHGEALEVWGSQCRKAPRGEPHSAPALESDSGGSESSNRHSRNASFRGECSKAEGWEHPFLLHHSHGDIHRVIYSLASPLRSLLSRRIQATVGGWGGGGRGSTTPRALPQQPPQQTLPPEGLLLGHEPLCP